jgi:hypothetical protein
MQITRQPACDELYLAKTKVIVEGAHTVETSNCINVIREITKSTLTLTYSICADMNIRINRAAERGIIE